MRTKGEHGSFRGSIMPDFRTSLGDFQRRYPEAACAAWLFTVRWPAGFRCPACAHEKGWPHGGKPFTFECAACGKQTSVTAGTIMHGSKLPLTAWFWAAYLMATQPVAGGPPPSLTPLAAAH